MIAETHLQGDPVISLCLGAAASSAAWRGETTDARRFTTEANYDETAPLLLVLTTELSLAEAELVAGLPERAARTAISIAERAADQSHYDTALRAYLIAARSAPSSNIAARLETAAGHCDYISARLHAQFARALADSDSRST